MAFSPLKTGALTSSTSHSRWASNLRSYQQFVTKPPLPRRPRGARQKALHRSSDRVLSASKPQAALHLFAKRTASTRTKTPQEQREQKQVFWAAMDAEEKVTLQSTVNVIGTLTGTSCTPRSSERIPP